MKLAPPVIWLLLTAMLFGLVLALLGGPPWAVFVSTWLYLEIRSPSGSTMTSCREARVEAVMDEIAAGAQALTDRHATDDQAEQALRRIAERCVDAADRVLPILEQPPIPPTHQLAGARIKRWTA